MRMLRGTCTMASSLLHLKILSISLDSVAVCGKIRTMSFHFSTIAQYEYQKLICVLELSSYEIRIEEYPVYRAEFW